MFILRNLAAYLPMISQVRALLSRSGKKSFTVCVGKPNPSKLANFAAIECFVLIACPENSIIDDKARYLIRPHFFINSFYYDQDYLQPVVTPFELIAALSASLTSWSLPYSLDFQNLLLQLEFQEPLSVKANDEETENREFSLVQDSYRRRKSRRGLNGKPSSLMGISLTEGINLRFRTLRETARFLVSS